MRDLEVVEVKIHGMTGYQIQGIWRACSDSLWETIAHAAVFRDKARAEKFLLRVKGRPSWQQDWKHWGKPVTYICNKIDCIQDSVNVYSVL
ncbi:MAG: hypothetical protein RLZZ196_700 [Bacteroidota bacterium]|jgi:hypothetical protein